MSPHKSTTITLALIAVFHVIGLIGIAFTDIDWFLNLTPFNLLVTAALIISADSSRGQLMPITLAIFLLGFIIELIGVNTNWPFGAYSYGEVLGWKWFKTPVIIGVNWFILMYATHGMAVRISKLSWVSALLAGGFMVLIDLLIEPVAIAIGFWSWEAAEPPLENYIAWFFIATGMSFLWKAMSHRPRFALSLGVMIIQASFFGMLWLILQ